MKESYDEGVANHIGPESCDGDRKGLSEALTGVRAGRVGVSSALERIREVHLYSLVGFSVIT